MAELRADELQELFVGTWIGLAVVVEFLIDSKALSRGEVTTLLSACESAVTGRRRTAISGLRQIIESGLGNNTGSLINRWRLVEEIRLQEQERQIRTAPNIAVPARAASISTVSCPMRRRRDGV
jgi:hypothetical protein